MEWRRLDDRALAYGREQLAHGHLLARACLEFIDETEPWARLPTDFPDDRAHDFGSGGVAPALHVDAALPVDALFGYLAADDAEAQRLLVFEDPYARRHDRPVVEGRDPMPLAFAGDRVYQLFTREQLGLARELPTGEFPIAGVASRLPRADAVHPGADLTDVQIAGLARNAAAIVVAAWDAENYIVFDRGLLARAA